MQRTSPLIVLTLAVSLVGCEQRDAARAVSASGPGLLIRGVQLVSPELVEPRADAWVLVRGERIEAVGDGEPPALVGQVEVLEGSGRFLTPGLIDGHVHLVAIAGMDLEQSASEVELAQGYYRQLPKSYLHSGFTTLVDLNLVDPSVLDYFDGPEPHPDVLHCGGGVTVANGYPMSFLPEESRFETFSNFLWLDEQAAAIPSRYAAEEHTPERAVERVVALGGSCVKSYWESGFLPGEDLPTPDDELMTELLAVAHRHELPLLVHANSLAAHRFAARVGVDAVAHGLWNWGSAQRVGGAGDLPAAVREVLDREIEAGVAYMPTLRVIEGLVDLLPPEFLDRPELRQVISSELIEWYRSEPGGWLRREILGDGSVEARVLGMSEVARHGASALAYISSQGGRILFGSDTPSAPNFANPPGLNGYWELRAMAAAGLTPRQILDAATLENARFFGIDGEVGSVEAGKRADLLLLARDPLESVDAWDSLETVIVGGLPIERAELSLESAGASTPEETGGPAGTLANGGGRGAARSGQRLGAR
jgi:imidazolonepropionase-like amidohydrolase